MMLMIFKISVRGGERRDLGRNGGIEDDRGGSGGWERRDAMSQGKVHMKAIGAFEPEQASLALKKAMMGGRGDDVIVHTSNVALSILPGREAGLACRTMIAWHVG